MDQLGGLDIYQPIFIYGFRITLISQQLEVDLNVSDTALKLAQK